jgi:hypothetical protein
MTCLSMPNRDADGKNRGADHQLGGVNDESNRVRPGADCPGVVPDGQG